MLGLWPGLAIAQWPQWGGPHHDFTCDSPGLAETWPADGPRKLWSTEIGPGHSAITVDDGRLYTMCRRDDQDVVLCFDAATGAKVWEATYAAPTKPDMMLEFGPGPHATPLVVKDRVFTIGGLANLRCWDKKTGKPLWGHDLMDELSSSHLGRGYGASPIAYEDLVIVNTGGGEVGVAAFKQDSGEVAWKSERFPGGYPTPVLVKLNSEDHLLCTLGPERVALDPATGKTRWRTTVDRQLAAIMATPLWIPPDRVLYSCAYGGGTQLFKVTQKDGQYAPEEVWFERKMKVMHGTFVRIGDYVYGSSGDFGPAFLMAINVETGKIAWRERGFAKATLLLADGKLIILDEDGTLAVATATPEGLKVHAQAKVLTEKSWTVPTLVGSRLYLRDRQTIMALELGATGNG